ncbi:ABC transporter ATP-binding protein [Rhizobium puerariae]|uniref:ABC transporter ATP-binding protein n=1 Tax=Rhizobium puerariae TaxID=1585791 RepID=A0ABV6ARH5_9HYPH
MTLFQVSSVDKIYPGTPPVVALQDISLTIEQGEFIVFLGPSGCGKSTLLELLSGLQQPSDGQVAFHGEPIEGPHHSLGVVFQDASLLPWRTIEDNVSFGLELAGIGKAQRNETARHYLDKVGLTGFAEKYPHQLSGGMRQRAGIARALSTEPEVLLMDEPFGAVDHITRIKLQEELIGLWQENRRTIVFVTHDVGEAAFLADRIVLFSPRPGRVHTIFDVELPRPRRRGDLELLKLESKIYDTLHAVEQESRPSGTSA